METGRKPTKDEAELDYLIDGVEHPTNNTSSEVSLSITMSDDDSEEGSESISSSTSYSTDMHSSGDNTDREVESNLLDTDENSQTKPTEELKTLLHKAEEGDDTETSQQKVTYNKPINWEMLDGGEQSELNGFPPI